MNKKIHLFFVPAICLLIASAFLVSCNIPTSAAVSQTAQDTPTVGQAPLATPTVTEQATASPTIQTVAPTTTGVCDRALYIADVTYPDNTVVPANEAFTKTWKIQNVGDCTWDANYKLVFNRGEQMDGPSPAAVITTPVKPGDTVELSIPLKASPKNGTHWGVWQLYNGAGKPVTMANGNPQELSIMIRIQDGTGGTVTQIRSWRYTFTGIKCSSDVQYDIWTSIYANGPVAVNFVWASTNGQLTVVSQSYTFTESGSQEVTTHLSPPFANPNNIKLTLTANSSIQSSFTICP